MGRAGRAVGPRRLSVHRGLQAVFAGRDGSHRRQWRPVHHRPTSFPRRGRRLPGLAPNPHPELDPSRPPRWARRRARTGLLHDPGTTALGRGVPNHLGPLHRQSRPRRRHPQRPHRSRDRRGRGTGCQLAGPRSRYKTRVAVEQAAAAALAQAHADRWVTATVTQTTAKTYKQARRGRPGPETNYREITTNRFALAADIDIDHVAHDAASDGCFPLITNDRNLSDAQVLAAYRYQPNLERRHHLLKSVQDAAPVLLKNPARIEALFCCQFLDA